MIRNILGGFLFSGDDIYKKVKVLSGGERTRLAVARMLLRPSNTLLLDEPTNHLDLDSKEVLLDALVDYGGTLIFVSHDRYFVERLATKVIEVGNGGVHGLPGHLPRVPVAQGASRGSRRTDRRREGPPALQRPGVEGPVAEDATAAVRRHAPSRPDPAATAAPPGRDERKRIDAELRKKQKAGQARKAEVERLEGRIAETESAIRELEARMAAPGFYDDRGRRTEGRRRPPGADVEGRTS